MCLLNIASNHQFDVPRDSNVYTNFCVIDHTGLPVGDCKFFNGLNFVYSEVIHELN